MLGFPLEIYFYGLRELKDSNRSKVSNAKRPHAVTDS